MKHGVSHDPVHGITLVRMLAELVDGYGWNDPSYRIRLAEEFTALVSFLRVLPGGLKPGGLALVLTFRAAEDRRVKKMFQVGEPDGIDSELGEEGVIASPEERRVNPKSVWRRRCAGRLGNN